MTDSEYKKLTSHIITFLTTMLERGVVDGKREDFKSLSTRLEIIREDKYHRKSSLHNEPISMLDALCGIVAKINKRKNNDLTTRQIDMFNRIVKDFSKAICKDENALNGELINMVNVDDSTTEDSNTFGNKLFTFK
ncbi:hypothetical protein [uncultured Mediterranean phage]|nr:hypothetical protein [uncultured Mediterranean phage]